jgi:hypothetical protein
LTPTMMSPFIVRSTVTAAVALLDNDAPSI